MAETTCVEAQEEPAVTAAAPAAPEAAPATTTDPKEARAPIVWTGRAREAPAPTPAAAPEPDQDVAAAAPAAEARPAQRLKPNAAFLLNVVADAERGNARRCAEDATAVSLSVLEKVRLAGHAVPVPARLRIMPPL